MQTVLPSEFKRGMVLMLDGAPQVLEDWHVSGTAQTRHKLHARIRNLKSGRVNDRVFAENERVPIAQIEQRRVQLSYRQGEDYVFSDVESFEELSTSKGQLGDRHWFVKEDEEYRAVFLEGKLLDIVLPPVIRLRVTETSPTQKGGSDASWKEAVLETGLQVMVPLFITNGDLIRVDTLERKYIGKESEDRKS